MTQTQKYLRTYHLPWSKGIQSDDKIIPNHILSTFKKKEIIVTEKMDGENTTLYTDYMHARSLDSRHNFTRDWVKKMHSVIRFDLVEDWRFVGENMWAEHSIRYEDGELEGYFYLFAIFNQMEEMLSYQDTVDHSLFLHLPMPKVLYRGIYDEKILKKLADELDETKVEGYVMRLASKIPHDPKSDFLHGVAKVVRANHVQENAEHWLKNAKQNGALKTPTKPFFMG